VVGTVQPPHDLPHRAFSRTACVTPQKPRRRELRTWVLEGVGEPPLEPGTGLGLSVAQEGEEVTPGGYVALLRLHRVARPESQPPVENLGLARRVLHPVELGAMGPLQPTGGC